MSIVPVLRQKPENNDIGLTECLKFIIKKLVKNGVKFGEILRVMQHWNPEFLDSSSSPVLSEVFGDYLQKTTDDLENMISSLKNNYEEDLKDIETMKNECKLLDKNPRIFGEPHVCSECGLTITELPVCHFSCMHSFHLGCLEFNQKQGSFKCSLCSNEVDHRTAMHNQKKLEQGTSSIRL